MCDSLVFNFTIPPLSLRPLYHSRPSHQALTLTPTPNLPNDARIPDTPECFPWVDGGTDTTAGILEDAINDVTSGSVVVNRAGNMAATSAYGYTYDIDFTGDEERGDMDLRCELGLRICYSI